MSFWGTHLRSKRIALSGLVLAALTAAAGGVAFANSPSASSQSYTLSGNTPGFVSTAKDLGAVDPSTVISVTVWLKLHNEAQLDTLAQQQSQ